MKQEVYWRQSSAAHRKFSLSCTLQETYWWVQSKHITSRWTRNEIFLCNNFLSAVKVTDLTWLVICSDRNGLVETAATRVTEKAWFKGKVSFWEGLIADDWWWPCEQRHSRARGLSNRKLILASCSSSTATHPCVWGVRMEQGLVRDCFCLSLAFSSLAFRMECNVFVFEWGFPGMFS